MGKADTTTEVSELSETPSFQEAFAAAKLQHAAAAEEGEQTDEAEGETTTTADEGTIEEKVDETKTTTDATGLLTDAEFSALQTEHKDDPAALRKSLEKAFTQKTQKLAEAAKSTERLEKHRDVIEAYDADPEATVRELAKSLGLTFADESETKTEETKVEVKAQPKPIDFDYDMDKWSEAHAEWSKGEVARLVSEAIQPLKVGQQTILEKHAAESTETVMKALTAAHPDWTEHEPAMLALSLKLAPAQGMTENEYLEHLYTIVTAPKAVAAAVKDVDAKVAAGVKAALAKMEKGAASTDTKTGRTPEDQVTAGPPNGRAPTFSEAFAAAKRGERWN